MRALPLSLSMLLLGAVFAGCFETPGLTTNAEGGAVQVTTLEGAPLPVAAATLLDAAGVAVGLVPADADGRILLAPLAAASSLVVSAPGHQAWKGAPADLPGTIALAPLAEVPAADDAEPVLRFLPALEMGPAYLLDNPLTCAISNCGASEPSVEVAGDGSVYVTGVCCIGKSPPIWVSRDGGATFTHLEGDALQEGFGIEGDFAVDDAGNVYFSDISAASSYFSSWDAEGNHRWTMPAWPFKPLVDRPWVRADAEDHVVFAYNTGSSTVVATSDDGARTWTTRFEAPGNLGSLGQGPERTRYWLTADGMLYTSEDAGHSWSEVGEIPKPFETTYRHQAYEVPVADEAGNLWIVYDAYDGANFTCESTLIVRMGCSGVSPSGVYAVRLDPAGEWHGPFRVSPEAGEHVLPWAATGRDGTLVVAWYGAPTAKDGQVADKDEWFLHVAVTLDGTGEAPSWQVAQPDEQHVLVGPMARRLLDFLQVDVGPDGAIHVAYAKLEDGAEDEATWYVRSTVGLDLAPAAYPNGPHAE